jgi:hypothetical protein
MGAVDFRVTLWVVLPQALAALAIRWAVLLWDSVAKHLNYRRIGYRRIPFSQPPGRV